MAKEYNWRVYPSSEPYEIKRYRENVICISGGLKLESSDLGCRMTLIKLKSNKWLLHSPIPPTSQIFDFIDQLGVIQIVVAPNSLHHLFIDEYLKKYGATLLAVQDALDKTKIGYKNTELLDDSYSELKTEFEIEIVKGKKVEEAVLFHIESKTLMLTDLAFNRRVPRNLFMRFVEKHMGMSAPLGPSVLAKYVFFGDSAPFRSSLKKIASWDFERVTMCHGEVIESGGKSQFINGFKKYLN